MPTTEQTVAHTPGPWAISGATIHTVSTAERPRLRLARLVSCQESDAVESREQEDANGLVMAAAPDLLAIARRIADMGDRLLTGELDPPTPPHYRGSFALSQLVGDTIAAIAKAEGGAR